MKIEKRLLARELRKEGKSIKEIARLAEVSQGSVSVWCRDIKLSDLQLNLLSKRSRPNYSEQIERRKGHAYTSRLQRIAHQEAGKQRAAEGDLLHAQACMLYWAEGAKDRASVDICNSNPDLLLLFKNFLLKEFEISKSQLLLRLALHEDTEIEECKRFWSSYLSLSTSQIKDVAIKKSGGKRQKKIPYGMCTLRLHSVEVAQHIFWSDFLLCQSFGTNLS